jgi:hypothetical protein
MKLRDICNDDDRALSLIESASAGATGSASVASVANPMGAINRRPSLFGYIPAEPRKKRKKK